MNHHTKKTLFSSFFKYFLQGLLFTLPIAGTLYVIYFTFVTLDNLLPFNYPGLGLVIVVVLITLMGALGSTVIAKPVKYFFEKLFSQTPLLKIIYTSIKDLLSAFVGDQKKFNQPVLVKMSNESNIYKLGFVTQKDLSQINIHSNMSAVYLPHSYNFSGNLFIVPNEHITPIDAPAADVMKFIVSGGVTRIEKANKNISKE